LNQTLLGMQEKSREMKWKLVKKSWAYHETTIWGSYY
jgi:hypothetical protein